MSPRRNPLRLLVRGPGSAEYTPGWLARQVATAGALSLVMSAIVNLFLPPSGRYLTFWQLWLLITAALLVTWFGQTLGEPSPRPEVVPEPATGGTDRPYPVADRWARRLSVTSGDPEWFGRVVRDRLAVLVAERLRQRHGVRLADPERARHLLGDELYVFLTAPLTRIPSPAELGRLITRMEQI